MRRSMIPTMPLDDQHLPTRTPAFRLHFPPHPLSSPSPRRGEGFKLLGVSNLHFACILLMRQAA
jgi:hypothetical protein